jgi:hypothetical protein
MAHHFAAKADPQRKSRRQAAQAHLIFRPTSIESLGGDKE